MSMPDPPAPPRPPAQELRESLEQAARILREWAGDRQRGQGKWTLREQAAVDCAIRLEAASLTAAPRPSADWNEAEDLVGSEAPPRIGNREFPIRAEARPPAPDALRELMERVDTIIRLSQGAESERRKPNQVSVYLRGICTQAAHMRDGLAALLSAGGASAPPGDQP